MEIFVVEVPETKGGLCIQIPGKLLGTLQAEMGSSRRSILEAAVNRHSTSTWHSTNYYAVLNMFGFFSTLRLPITEAKLCSTALLISIRLAARLPSMLKTSPCPLGFKFLINIFHSQSYTQTPSLTARLGRILQFDAVSKE